MAGTKAGGLSAAETNKAKHGADFYSRIGSIGGKLGHTGGTYANPEWAAKIGSKGGQRSKRGYKFVAEVGGYLHYIKNDTGETVAFKVEG